jgi:RNA polymerase sigma-70 factor (ECF subfamily)
LTVSFAELEEILPDQSCENRQEGEITEHINAFLRMQGEMARNVFIRKYYFFDSVEDIMRRYGFTESKVKNMLYHTRNKLKSYLHEKGVEL